MYVFCITPDTYWTLFLSLKEKEAPLKVEYNVLKLKPSGGASVQQLYIYSRQRNQSAKIFRTPEHIRDHPEVKHKTSMVSRAEEGRKCGVPYALSASLLGVSRSVLFSWKRYIANNQWNKLITGSRRPHRVRETTLTHETIVRFIALRIKHPGFGARKIAVMLTREGYTISFSQADRLVTVLLREKKIVPARGHFLGKQKRKTPYIRQPKPETPTAPGDILQVDSLYLGAAGWQITGIDVVSRVAVTDIFPACTAKAARALLIRAQEILPFPIRCVQTDGGGEFRGEANEWMAEEGIHHHTLPPRSPKLNGCVERQQGVWRQEFWQCYPVPSYRTSDLQSLVREWEYIYNYVRPHGALGYQTPMGGLTHNRGGP